MGQLEGKVAFITGAGSGIGRGIAERFAREGADICIADIDEQGAEHTANLVGQLGRKAITVKTNVASKQHLTKAVDACVEKLGRLDIGVANAGIARGGSVLDMPEKDWQDQIDINLTGVFLTVQAVANKMVSLGNGGRMICISSLAAENTGAGFWAYSATKSGVRMMVRGWGQDLGHHGITVNAIGPGVIETPLAAGLAGEEGGAIRRNLEARTPAGRAGQPSDIAGLATFMAGPDGEFMRGAYVLMDGGLRDANGNGQPSDDEMQESVRVFSDSTNRREKMQAWIDDRN